MLKLKHFKKYILKILKIFFKKERNYFHTRFNLGNMISGKCDILLSDKSNDVNSVKNCKSVSISVIEFHDAERSLSIERQQIEYGSIVRLFLL